MMHGEKNPLTRREVIRGTGAMTIASLVASAGGMGTTPQAQSKSASNDSAPLGQRIRGFQHFGMTVQNMDRAFAFYTEILGGTEIMRDGDFHGEKIHNTLMLNDDRSDRTKDQPRNNRSPGPARRATTIGRPLHTVRQHGPRAVALS